MIEVIKVRRFAATACRWQALAAIGALRVESGLFVTGRAAVAVGAQHIRRVSVIAMA